MVNIPVTWTYLRTLLQTVRCPRCTGVALAIVLGEQALGKVEGAGSWEGEQTDSLYRVSDLGTRGVGRSFLVAAGSGLLPPALLTSAHPSPNFGVGPCAVGTTHISLSKPSVQACPVAPWAVSSPPSPQPPGGNLTNPEGATPEALGPNYLSVPLQRPGIWIHVL